MSIIQSQKVKPSAFLEAITELRNSRGITQERMSKLLGISTYSYVETGYVSVVPYAERIIDILAPERRAELRSKEGYDTAVSNRLQEIATSLGHTEAVPFGELVEALRWEHGLRQKDIAPNDPLSNGDNGAGDDHTIKLSIYENRTNGKVEASLNSANAMIAQLDAASPPDSPKYGAVNEEFYQAGLAAIAKHEERQRDLGQALYAWRHHGATINGKRILPAYSQRAVIAAIGAEANVVQGIEKEAFLPGTHWIQKLLAFFGGEIEQGRIQLPPDVDETWQLTEQSRNGGLKEKAFIEAGLYLFDELPEAIRERYTPYKPTHATKKFAQQVKALREEALGVTQTMFARHIVKQFEPLIDPDKRKNRLSAITTNICYIEKEKHRNGVTEEKRAELQRYFALEDPDRFEAVANAAIYVGDIRLKHFQPALKAVVEKQQQDTGLKQKYMAADIGCHPVTLLKKTNKEWKSAVRDESLLRQFGPASNAVRILKANPAYYDKEEGQWTEEGGGMLQGLRIIAQQTNDISPELLIYRQAGIVVDEEKFKLAEAYRQEFAAQFPAVFRPDAGEKAKNGSLARNT